MTGRPLLRPRTTVRAAAARPLRRTRDALCGGAGRARRAPRCCVPPCAPPSPDAGRPRRQRTGLGGRRSRRRAHRPAARSASRFLHGRAAAARRGATGMDALFCETTDAARALGFQQAGTPDGVNVPWFRRTGEPVPLPAETSKITFTSGTTGTPKGVCLSAAQQRAVARRARGGDERPRDRTASVAPPAAGAARERRRHLRPDAGWRHMLRSAARRSWRRRCDGIRPPSLSRCDRAVAGAQRDPPARR